MIKKTLNLFTKHKKVSKLILILSKSVETCFLINREWENLPAKKNHFLNVTLFLSILIQVAFAVRLVLFRIKSKPTGFPAATQQQQPAGTGNESQILSDVLTCVFFISSSGLLGYLTVTINNFEPAVVNVYPNYFFMYGLHFGSPFVASATFVFLFYARNKDLRSTLLSETKEWINRHCDFEKLCF